MSIIINVSPAKVIAVGTAALAIMKKQYDEEVAAQIERRAYEITQKNGFLFWRLIFGAKITMAEAKLIAAKEVKETDWESYYWHIHYSYSCRKARLEQLISTAKGCDNQEMTLTKEHASAYVYWLDHVNA